MKVMQKVSEKDKDSSSSHGSPEKASESGDAPSGGNASQGEDSMKHLLEEAGKMLKSLNVEGQQRKMEVEDKGHKLDVLQKQLDELRKMNLKVFRLSKLRTAPGRGLLDSGATHPLRPRRKKEDVSAYPKVQVALAGGNEMEMSLAPTGVIVGDFGVEPIVPMGMVTSALGCQLKWDPSGLQLLHPVFGNMKVEIVDGCPLMSAEDTLKLIHEIEEKKAVVMQSMKVQGQHGWEQAWLRQLADQYPAFEGVPEHIKDALIAPLEDVRMIANRRRRKLWKKEGMVAHAFSGDKSGYTLSRALKEIGGDHRRLHEFDQLHGGTENDFGVGGQAYGLMLRLAFDGVLRGWVGGPPCRTRSVLRHQKVESIDNMPRPVRAWMGEEFGKEGLSAAEASQVLEDDILLFRFIMVHVIAEEIRKMEGRKEKTMLGLEQPAEALYCPEAVCLWKTRQWEELAKAYDLERQTFHQGDFGGPVAKPTTVGGNMRLSLPPRKKINKPRKTEGLTKEEICQQSRELSRWVPGFMRQMAISIQTIVFKGPIKICKLSWAKHIAADHTPFRRDCAICQEAAAKDYYHKRSRLPPKAGILSLDVAGPLKKAPDLMKGEAKYLLVGTFTWPSRKQNEDEEKSEVEDQEIPADAPEIEDMNPDALEEGIFGDVDEDPRDKEHPVAGKDQEESHERKDEEAPLPGEEGEAREVKIDVQKIVVPMSSRSQIEVMKHIVDIYLRLRADGYIVSQLHTDCAGEFQSKALASWCTTRTILHSFTPGDQPQSNGRAEAAVAQAKSCIRRMLLGAGADFKRWPIAARCLNERWRREATGTMEEVPPFLASVLTRKRFWRSRELEPTQERVTYLAPSWLRHGHWVERPDGSQFVARMVMSKVAQPPTEEQWIGVEDHLNELELRRRVRGKVTVRQLKVCEAEEPEACEVDQVSTEGEEQEKEKRFSELVEEEMTHAVCEEQAALDVVLDAVARLRQAVANPTEEQEVLQTRIVSQQEVRKKAKEWDPAIAAELTSLFETKGALKRITEREGKCLIEQGKAEVIPAKVVYTIKPVAGLPQGKLKARIVACSNFIAQDDPQVEVFASGTNAVSVRIGLSLASQLGWYGLSTDIRTAFLNADMKLGQVGEESGEEREERIALMRPPPILVELGFAKKDEWWLVVKAIYGYKQSPRLWSDYRDERMAQLRVEDGGKRFRLQQLLSEPNIWKILEIKPADGHESLEKDWLEDWMVVDDEEPEHSEKSQAVLRGILLVYVDDLLILGEQKPIQLVVEAIRSLWETSTPEEINEESGTRFLGMELWRSSSGVWKATQINYTTDLLQRNLQGDMESWQTKKVPMPKDMEFEEESERSLHQVREAQRVVGELIWLSTRCRPDLMFTMSKLSSGITKYPCAVVAAASQVWKFLAGTIHHGLEFSNHSKEFDLNIYSDASFGDQCQGCTIVQWGKSLLLWKSSKQALMSSSTAEAELIELLDAATAGEAIRVVIEELLQRPARAKAFTDSSSALAIATGDSGSWRTRHLRRRALSLRWRVTRGDWVVRHTPGSEMPADIGTKPLTFEKFSKFKEMMGMSVDDGKKEKSLQKKEKEKQTGEEEPSEKGKGKADWGSQSLEIGVRYREC